MILEDPNNWAQGANAFKAIFDGLRSAIGLLRDMRSSGASLPEQQKLVDNALEKASTAAKIAEAEVAKALGFTLCKCTFPPIPMLTVGNLNGRPDFGPVYECPKRGYNTAAPKSFMRIAPPRVGPQSPA